jgi:CubicO group peptidase (beta-lactamase class C family)
MFRTLALAASLLTLSCKSDSTPPVDEVTDDGSAYWPADSWRVASAKSVGMDQDRLDALVSKIRKRQIADLNGVVVIRHGYKVMEEYANGSSANQVHEMQSVTKSVTSLLVGIAIDQGRIGGVNTKLLSYFPEYTDIHNMDARKQSVTLESILSMRSGVNFYEDPYPGSPLDQLNSSTGDWLRIFLDQPMNAAPDELWQYNSGGVISLGGVIYNTTHVSADQFANQYLFQPLGINLTYWFKGNPNGLPHMGGGLSLRAQDLARIGYLVLRRGKWNGQQIVSEKWISESTAHLVRRPRSFFNHVPDYGYLWWLFPLDNVSSDGWDNDIITASGAKGQWLFIVPKYDLVVAATSNSATGQGFIDPLYFLYSDIIPSIVER